MKYIRLFEDFQLGDLNVMSPEQIEGIFFDECGKGHPNLELIKVILENRLVDVNKVILHDRTALHLSISRSNNPNLVKLLIEMGADVNLKDFAGRTPLEYAMIIENPILIDLLWKHEHGKDYSKMVVFSSKGNSVLDAKICVIVTKEGRVGRIANGTGVRFPFQIGQAFNKTFEVWACNNNFLMDGKDTCPEEKIFGIRKKDIPAGHDLRKMFASKFK